MYTHREDKERALPKLSMQGALPGQATTKAIATFEAVEEAIHAIQVQYKPLEIGMASIILISIILEIVA